MTTRRLSFVKLSAALQQIDGMPAARGRLMAALAIATLRPRQPGDEGWSRWERESGRFVTDIGRSDPHRAERINDLLMQGPLALRPSTYDVGGVSFAGPLRRRPADDLLVEGERLLRELGLRREPAVRANARGSLDVMAPVLVVCGCRTSAPKRNSLDRELRRVLARERKRGEHRRRDAAFGEPQLVRRCTNAKLAIEQSGLPALRAQMQRWKEDPRAHAASVIANLDRAIAELRARSTKTTPTRMEELLAQRRAWRTQPEAAARESLRLLRKLLRELERALTSDVETNPDGRFEHARLDLVAWCEGLAERLERTPNAGLTVPLHGGQPDASSLSPEPPQTDMLKDDRGSTTITRTPRRASSSRVPPRTTRDAR